MEVEWRRGIRLGGSDMWSRRMKRRWLKCRTKREGEVDMEGWRGTRKWYKWSRVVVVSE